MLLMFGSWMDADYQGKEAIEPVYSKHIHASSGHMTILFKIESNEKEDVLYDDLNVGV